jgi:chromatin remodeling complex protein RSC6
MAIRKRTTKKKAVRKTRKTTARRPMKKKSKAKKATSGKRRTPFGGYTINFKNISQSLEDVFGKKPVTPSEMTKKLWAYVKRHKLNG